MKILEDHFFYFEIAKKTKYFRMRTLYTFYNDSRRIPPAAVGNITVFDIILLHELLKREVFILLPTGIIKVFIKNNYSPHHNFVVQELKHCLCRTV